MDSERQSATVRKRGNQLSRIPFFNSQTRKAARINLFVRAIVPIPGIRGSLGGGSISRWILCCDRRLGAILGERGRVGTKSTGAFSLEAD